MDTGEKHHICSDLSELVIFLLSSCNLYLFLLIAVTEFEVCKAVDLNSVFLRVKGQDQDRYDLTSNSLSGILRNTWREFYDITRTHIHFDSRYELIRFRNLEVSLTSQNMLLAIIRECTNFDKISHEYLRG